MATVFVPGVAQTVLSGQIGSNPWAVVHHWQFGTLTAPWNSADIAALAQGVYTAWGVALKAQAGNNVDTRQVSAVDLTNSAGVSNVYTHAPTNGTYVGAVEPASLSMVVRNLVHARYRGGHPRTYWPLNGQATMVNEYQWNSGALGPVRTAILNFFAQVYGVVFTVTGSPLQHVIPRYTYAYTDVPGKHKYTKQRVGLNGAPLPVFDYLVDLNVGSQRRRLKP